MKRKKNKSPQQLYQAARGNLLLMLIFSAVNVSFAAFGVDIYFLFSDYLAYMLALTGRVFLEYTDEGLYLAVGLASAVLVLVPYLLCWIFSKKRRGWMIAALVLFAVDTGALVVDTLGSDDVLYNLPDLLFHIWVLVYLVLGVKHAQQALAPQPEETPATQPLVESTFYDASLGGQPNTPSLGAQPRPDGAGRGRAGLRPHGGHHRAGAHHFRPHRRPRRRDGVLSHRPPDDRGRRRGDRQEAAAVLSV